MFVKLRWQDNNGDAYCPHCGSFNALLMEGKAHREGLYHCRDCRGQFTVLTGSVMESSHLPLTKWVLAIRLMTASKKGMSAHQLHRLLGVFHFGRVGSAQLDRSGLFRPAAAPREKADRCDRR